MAAIQRTRISSFGVGMFVVAVSAALMAGASGGYLVRALTSQVAAPSQPVQYQRVTGDNQDLTQSDLTRAQPAQYLPVTGDNQDLTQSDLTRAQPAQYLPVTGDKQDLTQSDLTRAQPADGQAPQSGASNQAPALQLQP